MAHLTLSLLGGLAASVDGVPVTKFDTDKTRALLAYIAAEAARPHAREALAGLLWPELAEDASRRNLRNSLFKLRQALDEEGASTDFLIVTPQTVQLDPAGDCSLDAVEFAGLIATSRAHRHRKVAHCTSCHARLQSAAELYRGDFLKGFHLADCQEFEEWLVLKRERMHHEALDTLDHLAKYHVAHAEYEQALHYVYRQLELESWREEAHRQAIGLLAITGRRSAALAQYEACRQALAVELNAEPSGETIALYERLKTGEVTGDGLLPKALAPRHNLPRQLTPFIGRREELARITERLDSPDYCLITLMGPGGVGKTRLALQAASRQVGAFEDGVYWVPLASAHSPHLLASNIAQAIGFHFEAAEDPQAQLFNYLSDKEMLLMLDNFEHLLAGGEATEFLLSILRSAPQVSILVTSRERLGLQAENLLDLSGLPLPGNVPTLQDPSELMAYDVVQLFVERAQQANSGFALAADTAQGVVDICRLVAGLPLGIVLAAAWVRHFSPARIAASIGADLDFLTSSSRDASPQHSSLRAVFNHSWNLLPAEEQRIFRDLSVFRGGWGEEAAEGVAGAPLRLLLSLVDKSLLRRSAAGRFEMHEVLRQHAAEKLDDLPAERDEIRRRHAGFYLDFAEAAEVGLAGEQLGEWLERLEREHDNLRAALQWASDTDDAEVGLRLGAALSRFWFVRGYYSEGREALASVLALSGASSQAISPQLVAIEAFRAKALRAAGDLDRAQGDYAGAGSRYEESLAIYREVGDKRDIAIALMRVAIVAFDREDQSRARSMYEESLALSREVGDKKDIAIALGNLGISAFVEGDYATARSQLEEALALTREFGDKFGLAVRINNLANVELMQGDYAGARALHEEALALRRELGDKWGIAICLIGIGGIEVGAGDVVKGTRLLGAAEALLAAIGASLESDDRIPYEYGVTSARARLDEASFERARAEGAAMSSDQAIRYALGD